MQSNIADRVEFETKCEELLSMKINNHGVLNKKKFENVQFKFVLIEVLEYNSQMSQHTQNQYWHILILKQHKYFHIFRELYNYQWL